MTIQQEISASMVCLNALRETDKAFHHASQLLSDVGIEQAIDCCRLAHDMLDKSILELLHAILTVRKTRDCVFAHWGDDKTTHALDTVYGLIGMTLDSVAVSYNAIKEGKQ